MSPYEQQTGTRPPQDLVSLESPSAKFHRRSRSPRRHHRSSSHKRARLGRSVSASLPQNAGYISRHDIEMYRPIFALYLEVQKQLDVDEISEHEMKGRWRSFVGKWNRGELAEGWYRPQMFAKAELFVAGGPPTDSLATRESSSIRSSRKLQGEDSDEDVLGPALPAKTDIMAKGNKCSGPTIPNLQDLELRRGKPDVHQCSRQEADRYGLELAEEDALDNREQLRDLRRLDRKQQKERLEDIAPRAEAGSKDRMLEKKREKADSNRAFAAGKTEAGGVQDVPESDLLGADDEGIEGYKRQKSETERTKNEREQRREEILRARQADREQRVREYREKEARTMTGLVALAKARFG